MSKKQIENLVKQFTSKELAQKIIDGQKLTHEAEEKFIKISSASNDLTDDNTYLKETIAKQAERIQGFVDRFNKDLDTKDATSALTAKQIEIYRRKLMSQIDENIMLQSSIELGLMTKTDTEGGFFGTLPK